MYLYMLKSQWLRGFEAPMHIHTLMVYHLGRLFCISAYISRHLIELSLSGFLIYRLLLTGSLPYCLLHGFVIFVDG